MASRRPGRLLPAVLVVARQLMHFPGQRVDLIWPPLSTLITQNEAAIRLLTAVRPRIQTKANTAGHAIVSNLRLRYNPKEGNDFYVVFNEGRNTSLTREVPNLPVYSSRAVMVKYTYTFNL